MKHYIILLLYKLSSLSTCSSKAILGVDLGSLFMKVALVQRNSPLEIVTNLHSKRKTEQMVLFDQDSRFYGADAKSMIGRKPLKTPSVMTIMLGRDDVHPTVKILKDRHYPIQPIYNETRSGVCLAIDGMQYTPEELVAMVFQHAKYFTAAYGVGNTKDVSSQVRDCVLTVPSFYTQHERLALLDAAGLADLNVLALIDENTAAALHFGMDRIDEEPKYVLFYNMGNSALQVSLVKYFSYDLKESKFGKKTKKVGAFSVEGKGWDSTLGGDLLDARLVDYMANEFNEVLKKKNINKDVRESHKAMMKLRLQANKAKHVLSANPEIPIYIDSLIDDVSYQSHVSRAKFEEITHDLLERSVIPIQNALDTANKTLEDVDMIELIGGGMRVPLVQESLSNTLAKMSEKKFELGKHINSDESMALGAAFHGANVSTAFRVRHIGMSDVNPFPIHVSLQDLPTEGLNNSDSGVLGSLFGIGSQKQKDEKEEKDEETWLKEATLFRAYGRIGVKKTLAFTHDKDVLCSIDYENEAVLPVGSELSLARYNITGLEKFAKEMEEKGLNKPKVSLQYELSSSGLTELVKAEATVEEIVTVEEDVLVDDNETETESVTIDGDAKENDAETEKQTETNTEKDSKQTETNTEKDPKQTETNTEKDPKQTETNTEDAKQAETAQENSDSTTANASETSSENETTKEKNETETPPPKKKKKLVKVQKEKKKIHKRSLEVKKYHVGRIQPLSEELRLESKAKLIALEEKDEARIKLEETRNKLESYIYKVKNKLTDDADLLEKISTEEQRSNIQELAMKAEDWLYEDGYDAELTVLDEKYEELFVPSEEIFFRSVELEARPAAIKALEEKLVKVEALMKKWETTMPQVSEEERSDVFDKITKVRTWIQEQEEAQSQKKLWETPALKSTDAPLQTKGIESLVAKLSKKPKPKPPKKEKNETKEANETSSSNTTTDASNEEDTKVKDEETVEESNKAEKTPPAEEEEDDDSGDEEL